MNQTKSWADYGHTENYGRVAASAADGPHIEPGAGRFQQVQFQQARLALNADVVGWSTTSERPRNTSKLFID